jgi:hypothetical protein
MKLEIGPQSKAFFGISIRYTTGESKAKKPLLQMVLLLTKPLIVLRRPENCSIDLWVYACSALHCSFANVERFKKNQPGGYFYLSTGTVKQRNFLALVVPVLSKIIRV